MEKACEHMYERNHSAMDWFVVDTLTYCVCRKCGHVTDYIPETNMNLDEFKAVMLVNGFNLDRKYLKDDLDMCGWYAHRLTKIPCRPCSLNDCPVLVSVNPASLSIRGTSLEGAEVEVRGQGHEESYRLIMHGMDLDYIANNIDAIERRLIAAWNALYLYVAD